MLHIALCCLEGSTMSNLVHRRRRCARIMIHTILCLEGSTPLDGSVYPCLSPCDGCKDLKGRCWGWLKMSKLAQGFSDWRSINGSQEASCIYRKGFLWFLSFDLTGQMPHMALCCLEGSTPEDRFFFYHGLNG